MACQLFNGTLLNPQDFPRPKVGSFQDTQRPAGRREENRFFLSSVYSITDEL